MFVNNYKSIDCTWSVAVLDYPDSDGGSAVTEFEVSMTNSDSSQRSVYQGRDTDCMVAGLLPGRPYLFQVRAFNKAGVSFLVSFILNVFS